MQDNNYKIDFSFKQKEIYIYIHTYSSNTFQKKKKKEEGITLHKITVRKSMKNKQRIELFFLFLH